jgi:uncharacterized membrane protein
MENSLVVVPSEKLSALKTVGIISYTLHAIVAVAAVLPGVQASIGLLLVAMLIDLVKKGDAVGTWQESHFRFRIRTVLIAGALYLVTAPLWILLVLPGWAAWAFISFWFAYRIIKGFLRLLDDVAV